MKALAAAAPLAGHHPVPRSTADSVPGQGPCPRCAHDPGAGVQEAAGRCFTLRVMFLSFSLSFFFPVSLKKNQ